MIIICIIIFIIGLRFLFNNENAKFLVCLFSVEAGFGFVEVNASPLKSTDLFLVMAFLATIRGYSKNPDFFSLKNDPLAKIVLVVFVYVFFNFVLTIVTGADSLGYSFKWYRKYLNIILFFYFRSLPLSEIKKFIKYILIVSIIQGILYYAQVFTGIQILAGRIDEAGSVEEISRYLNYPKWALFFLLYNFFDDKMGVWQKWSLLLFWAAMLIFAQTRGPILTTGAAIGVYFLLKRKIKYVLYIAVFAVFFKLAIAPMFEYREKDNKVSAFEELQIIISDPLSMHETYHDSSDGTFMFRMAILAERIAFLIENPKFLPFGVGMIHEDSPNNKYIFTFGSPSLSTKYGREMLGSGDNDWVEILTRLGVVGGFLFALLLYRWGRYSIPKVASTNEALFTTVALLCICNVLNTMNTPPFRHDVAFIMFYMAVCSIYNQKYSKHKLC